MRRIAKVGGGLLLGAVVTGMTVWAMGALYYSPLPTLLHQLLAIAFGLAVAISIETRKERTEDYSSIKGFFKQYELTYVVADERDVIRLRTTSRQPPEEVYLYRTRIPPARARRLFLDYLREVNHLVEQPAFYNR